MQKINIMGIRSKAILNRTSNSYLVMQSITEEEELAIDNAMDSDDIVRFVLEEKYIIPTRDIFLYGQVDITKDSDCSIVKNAKIITEEINNAANIPSNFDYETGNVYSDEDGIFKCHDTWNKLDWFKFNHLLIGKPERIIIYKIDKKYVPRNRSTIKRDHNNAI